MGRRKDYKIDAIKDIPELLPSMYLIKIKTQIASGYMVKQKYLT